MIPQEFVEKVRQATDIVALIQQWVPLKKSGANHKGLCPFHNEKSPSFMVHQGKQIFHCFGCGEGGDVYGFMMKHEKLSFAEAVRTLAERAGLALPEESESGPQQQKEAQEREAQTQLLELAASWFRRNLQQAGEAQAARDYLARRGVTPEAEETFQLGWAPLDGQALLRAALQKGYSEDQLTAVGLVQRGERGVYSRFRSRLMFPIANSRNRIVGFGGRVLGDGEPKYLNSPETVLFSKSRLLFAWPQAKEAIAKKRQALLCEGYMDALACHQAGVSQAVATLGTALTEEHARQLKRYVDDVKLVFDADEAGLRAARRGCEVLLKAGMNVGVVRLDGAKDPDEFLKLKGRAEFEKRLENAQSVIDFFVAVELGSGAAAGEKVRSRVQVAQAVFPLLKWFPTAMEADGELVRLAERLELSLEAVKADWLDFEKGQLKPATAWVEKAPSGTARVPTGPTRRGRVEGEMLEILAAHPQLVRLAMQLLPVPELEDPIAAKAASILWQNPGQIVPLVEEDTEEFHEAESLLSRLAMCSEDKFQEPEKSLRRLACQRSIELLVQQKARLDDVIAQAPDSDVGRQALADAARVRKEIEELKQKAASLN